MGKISLGILDGVRGKVGNVVGSSWKGIDYIRAKADHRADPKTEAQVNQRTRFKAALELAQAMLSIVIRPIWNHQAGKMTGSNLFIKKNIGAFGSDGLIEDFSKLQFSTGILPLPANLIVKPNESVESGVVISWENVLQQGNRDDKLMLVAMDAKEQRIMTLFDIDSTRGDGTAEIVLPFEPRSEVYVYAFFGDVKGRSFTSSVYQPVTI